MASETPKLGLIIPDNGEFFDTWDQPVNDNFKKIDDILGTVKDEVDAAAGTQADLATRLAVSLNPDGTLIAPPEVVSARDSTIYDNQDADGAYSLDKRIEKGDQEVFNARQELASLLDSLASNSNDFVHNSIISAPNGFLSFTGANAKIDGSVTPIVCNINGYRQVVRSLKQTTISGAAGTYYLYLQRNPAGDTYLDSSGLGQNNGAAGSNLGKLNKFTDNTQNFVNLGVQPGDLLQITTVSSPNKFTYVVQSVIDANNLLIIGTFATAQGSLNYKLINPVAPSINFTATAPSKSFSAVSGKIFIGSAVFDGTQITSVSSFALKGRFEQFVQVTLISGNYSYTVPHGLGYFPKKISFFASQANDYSQPLEPLSTADMTSSTLQRSVIASMDLTNINVKNPTNGLFYRDFAGTAQTAGYLLIVAER